MKKTKKNPKKCPHGRRSPRWCRTCKTNAKPTCVVCGRKRHPITGCPGPVDPDQEAEA